MNNLVTSQEEFIKEVKNAGGEIVSNTKYETVISWSVHNDKVCDALIKYSNKGGYIFKTMRTKIGYLISIIYYK